MGFDALLKNQLGHGPKFQKLHIHLISIPGGRNWAYFRSMGSGFLDNCWFSKLPYLARKLGHWPKFQKWHIYSLSNPRARNLAHSRSTGSRFRDTGQFSYLGMNSKSCTYTLFLPPGGLKLSLFLLYWRGFPRYGPSFKKKIAAMKLGKCPKFQKLHIYICTLSTPRGRNWAYFCSTGSGFRDTGQFSKWPYLGMKLGKWPKPRTCTYTLFIIQHLYTRHLSPGIQRRYKKVNHWTDKF